MTDADAAVLARRTYIAVFSYVDTFDEPLGSALAYLLGAILTGEVIALDLTDSGDERVWKVFHDARIPAAAWKHIEVNTTPSERRLYCMHGVPAVFPCCSWRLAK